MYSVFHISCRDERLLRGCDFLAVSVAGCRPFGTRAWQNGRFRFGSSQVRCLPCAELCEVLDMARFSLTTLIDPYVAQSRIKMVNLVSCRRKWSYHSLCWSVKRVPADLLSIFSWKCRVKGLLRAREIDKAWVVLFRAVCHLFGYQTGFNQFSDIFCTFISKGCFYRMKRRTITTHFTLRETCFAWS